MHRLSKAFRCAAALVALSLSLGIVLPLVQHVCAMEHAAAMAHAAPAMPQCNHHSAAPPAQTAAAGAAIFDAQAPTPKPPCCLVGPVSPRAEAPALLPAPPQPVVALLPVLTAPLAEPNGAGQAEHALPSSPPSPTPVALHVLHATFLN